MNHYEQRLMQKQNCLWVLICTASLALSLFLQWNGRVQAIGGVHDSLRYIEMAESLIDGKWLGEYTHMTLIRPPVYPLFLTLNSKMEWSLHRSQAMLYLTSILLLISALRMADVSQWRVAAICALCSFHPTGLYASEYVASEAIYTSLATMVLAGCIGVMGTLKKSGGGVYLWAILLSAFLAAFWHVRSESFWLLPVGVVYASYILWGLRGCNRNKWHIVSATLVVPCLCVYLSAFFFQHQNKKHYGISVVHELNEPGLVSVFRWLTRLDGQRHHPHIPVTRAALNQAYDISPHFSMLKPFLSQQTGGQGWARFGCEWMGVCDELAGGWILWAVREAAASVGVYRSATSASRFFREAALEIETACKEDRVRCTDNPTGNMLSPPLKWKDFPRILSSCVKMAALSLTFGKLSEAIRNAPPLQPSAELVARYDRITHDQSSQTGTLSKSFFGIAIDIFQMIQVAGGIWILIALGRISITWRQSIHTGLTDAMVKKYWISGCLTVFVLSRIAIVAYIDAMSFYAQLRYLLLIYPALITLICMLAPFPILKHQCTMEA